MMKIKPLNLKNTQKNIANLFKGWLTFSFEISEDRLTCKSSLTAKAYDDEIYTVIDFFKAGCGVITFHFDFLEPDARALELINAFNSNVPYLKAYIQENNCLIVNHSVEYLTADMAAQNVKRAFDDLVDDDTVKYLEPLTQLTHPKE